MSYKVLVSDNLSDKGLSIFREAAPDIELEENVGLKKEELLKIIGKFHGLVVRSATKVDADVIKAADNLKVIGRAGIGVDNINVAEASKRGIIVMNTPEGNVVTTAEHAISLMCSLARRIPYATQSMKIGKWEKKKLKGRELFRKTLGIVGLGNIGRIVADRGLGLRMKVIAFDPFVSDSKAKEIGVDLVSLDELLSQSDFVTMHVPVNDKTRGMIDASAIEKMKKGAFLINAARGGLVDEAAVAQAIEAGRLSGAAFDVYGQEPPDPNNPLLKVENVVLTPHLGASTHEAQDNVAIHVADQMIDFLRSGAIRNALNAPSVSASLRESLGPWMALGRKVGCLAGQIHRGASLGKVRTKYHGQICELPTDPLGVSLLTGLLSARLENINDVNAPIVAKERNIEVVEEKSSAAKEFASTISIEVEGQEGKTEVLGTIIGGGECRIVQVDGARLHINPTGHVLLTRHHDRPGMIGKVGSILGDNKVNISRLVLSDDAEHARAAINIDDAASEAVLDQIRKVDGINEVVQIRFD